MKQTKDLYKAITTDDIDVSKWVIGLPAYMYKGNEIIAIETEEDYFDIELETLCQATGKFDKDKTMIFDGDVIEFEHKFGDKTVKETLTVYYSEQSASFMLGIKDCLLPFGMYDVSKGKVIGNKYDFYLKGNQKK